MKLQDVKTYADFIAYEKEHGGTVLLNNYIIDIIDPIDIEVCNGSQFLYKNENGEIISEQDYLNLDKEEQDNYSEFLNDIFQHFIIDEKTANDLMKYTNEVVLYLIDLKLYLWGLNFPAIPLDRVNINLKGEF